MTLPALFGGTFAKAAFRAIDGESRIIGKFGQITLNDDGSFDVWIVTPDRSPVGTRKLNNLVSAISATSWKPDIRVLTGDAWFTTTDPALVREIAFLLGIPKRRCYSAETLERMRKQARVNLKVST
jgi:hypothetical protein